ncbi:MAG: L-seryl-tRNA(Sec) selenium transferase [Myxococcota bacterium]|jgi:L-seryl-tRNA(Ser) seleniumtransferase|nr:L-seryl-tRNA(Sec) selenium transferase [Myxococcota bacterium]
MSNSPYRSLPGVDTLLEHAPLIELQMGHEIRAEAARAAIDAAREAIGRGESAPETDAIARDAADRARAMLEPSLRPVLNATGVIVHTNLGRAPLSQAAVQVATGACNLEYDLGAGRRGSRRAHVEARLRAMSGAEAALVVNNNAAAVFLALSALARGGQVIISRGELVEIGGSFRVPEIMAASGAILREVGTTNRTYDRDYAAAIQDGTAGILRVHRSNFRIEGFTTRPTCAELATVAHAHGLPLISDLGSGSFGALPDALHEHADPRMELADGADLVCFSGDKILGGPQAGILLGRADLIQRLAKHPLARALRVGKLTLAALDHTLMAYRAGRADEIPVWAMMHAPLTELSRRARDLADSLADAPAEFEVVPCHDTIGGGSHPGEVLDGVAVAIRPAKGSADSLCARLRTSEAPLVAVITDDRVLVHMRTLLPSDDHRVSELLHAALAA